MSSVHHTSIEHGYDGYEANFSAVSYCLWSGALSLYVDAEAKST